MEVKIDIKKTNKILFSILVTLALFSFAGQFFKYQINEGRDSYLVNLFTFGSEVNLPSYFESVMVLAAALLSFCTGRYYFKSNMKNYFLWQLLGAVLILLAIDEMLQFHETGLEYLKYLSDEVKDLFKLIFILFLVISVIFSLLYLKLFLELPQKIRYLFTAAAIIYFSGALGLKLFNLSFADHRVFNGFLMACFTGAEEILEMTGILLFIYATLTHLKSQFSEARVILK